MRAVSRSLLCAGMAMLICAGGAQAAEVKILVAGALQNAVRALAADFEKQSSDKVTVTSVNPAFIEKELTEHTYDVLAASNVSMASYNETGRIDAPSRAQLARTGIGVSIKAGARKPDLSSVEAFKKSVMGAKNVIYTDPNIPNASGAVTQHILTNAGLLDAVKAKGKMEGLAPGRELIAKGEYEIGFFNVSEATAPGVVLAGPVPAPLQQYTNYEVALVTGADNAKGGAAFLKFMTAKAAGARWTGAGMDQIAPQ